MCIPCVKASSNHHCQDFQQSVILLHVLNYSNNSIFKLAVVIHSLYVSLATVEVLPFSLFVATVQKLALSSYTCVTFSEELSSYFTACTSKRLFFFVYIWMSKHRTISQLHLPKTSSAAGKQNQTQGSSLNAELLYCWFSQGHQQEPQASKGFGCLSVQQNTSSVVIVFELCTNHAGTHANPWSWSLKSVSRLTDSRAPKSNINIWMLKGIKYDRGVSLPWYAWVHVCRNVFSCKHFIHLRCFYTLDG